MVPLSQACIEEAIQSEITLKQSAEQIAKGWLNIMWTDEWVVG